MGIYDYNPDELKAQAKVRAGTATKSNGLSGGDWAGMGLQLLGGYLQDTQAQKQREEDLAREDKLNEQQMQQSALQRMIDAQHWQDQQNQQTRQQNLSGLNFLANMRGNAQQEARRRSFRDTLLKAGA